MKNVRIGIDARFYHQGSAGLARYTQELIKHVAASRTDHTYVVFLRPEAVAGFQGAPNIETRVTNIPHYSFREQLLFGRQLEAANLDLVHFTNFNFPLRYRGPFVISINDLTLLRYAGRSRLSRLKIGPMRRVMRAGARRGAEILTYSQYQKDLIVREFQVPPEKISVVYLAVDEEFRPLPASKVTAFRRKKGLTKPLVMYTGQWRQHKNLVRLIKAMKLVRQQVDAQLVLVGKVDEAFPIIPRTIREQDLTDDVILTDFVPNEDLPYYYNAADVFAFPPLTEGFGLPPLEAMACGTAVAASGHPPMPEILGEAAAFFDPLDASAMADTLVGLLRDPRRRQEMVKRGFAQEKQYSWQKTAAQTLAAYERALAGKGA